MSKSIGRKVGFAAIFADITRRGSFSEASIHTAEMVVIKIALKKTHKRENKRLIIYSGSQSSIQIIEYNKENYLILNQNSKYKKKDHTIQSTYTHAN